VAKIHAVIRHCQKSAESILRRPHKDEMSEYAKRVLSHADLLRQFLRKGTAVQAAEQAYLLSENRWWMAALPWIGVVSKDNEWARRGLENLRTGRQAASAGARERRRGFQEAVDHLHAKNPKLSHTAISKKVAEGVRAKGVEMSARTVLRHTKLPTNRNPRKKL